MITGRQRELAKVSKDGLSRAKKWRAVISPTFSLPPAYPDMLGDKNLSDSPGLF